MKLFEKSLEEIDYALLKSQNFGEYYSFKGIKDYNKIGNLFF